MRPSLIAIIILIASLSSMQVLANCLDNDAKLRIGDPSVPSKNCKGPLALVTWEQALKVCPAGTHLPTVRELAKYGQSRGARGIIEIDQCKKLPNFPPNYSIERYLATGQYNGPDEFCYDSSGYTAPNIPADQNDLGYLPTYWTSTPGWMNDTIFIFFQQTGSIWALIDFNRDRHRNVWCFNN